ncbi:hypothetical protein ACIPQH_30330 [Streptomyces rubiginosohelvolus]|uniref:hypothetical protein n=1 Tax=Streptomyces rubiginosohelvolus TaxID=67362 RepID=UPI0037F2DFC0
MEEPGLAVLGLGQLAQGCGEILKCGDHVLTVGTAARFGLLNQGDRLRQHPAVKPGVQIRPRLDRAEAFRVQPAQQQREGRRLVAGEAQHAADGHRTAEPGDLVPQDTGLVPGQIPRRGELLQHPSQSFLPATRNKFTLLGAGQKPHPRTDTVPTDTDITPDSGHDLLPLVVAVRHDLLCFRGGGKPCAQEIVKGLFRRVVALAHETPQRLQVQPQARRMLLVFAVVRRLLPPRAPHRAASNAAIHRYIASGAGKVEESRR